MNSDRLSPSELNEYHKYRKKLRHLYLCLECGHGFDREKPTTKCVFCGGKIKELDRDDIPAAKKMFRYICSACDYTFVAEHAERCPKCNGRFLHFYEATKISTREVLSMRKKQLKGKLKKIIKLKRDAKSKTGK